MAGSVTEREELAPLTSDETIEGYLPSNENVAKSLAAHADATGCIYFEGALTDRPGGVVRVEARDKDAIMLDLEHVLPGYTVVGMESLIFSPEAAIDRAVENGEITEGRWLEMSERDQEDFLKEKREQFREENGIQQSVDLAVRIELVRDRPQ